MSTIRFARLSFEPKLSHFTDSRDKIERRKEALLEVINWETDVNRLLKETSSSYLTKRGDWGFGGVITGDTFIAGRIGKEKDREGRMKDPEKRDYVPVERKYADVAFFVIDLDNMIMAYEYKRSPGKKAPYRIIRDVFNNHHDGEEIVSFSPLVDREEFSQELRNIDVVTQLHFVNLHPTNPGSTERSEPMDNFLRRSGIDDLLLNASSGKEDNERGIQVREEPLLDGGLSLAEEGYGRAEVRGRDTNGNEKRVTTEETPKEAVVEIEEENDSRNREKLLREIRDILKQMQE